MEFAKVAKIDGKALEVVTPEMYGANKELYQNTRTAIEVENFDDGRTYILPVRNVSDDRPGIYDAGSVYFTKFPEQGEQDKYALDTNKDDIIDYNNTKDVEDFISKQKQLRDIESEILTDIDNVFAPPIDPEDSPEMIALKEATREKRCDINKYAGRFGSNFLNDKRIFKEKHVSLNKILRIANNLDMEVELVIRDKGPEVPNPMGTEVHAILTTGGSTNDE